MQLERHPDELLGSADLEQARRRRIRVRAAGAAVSRQVRLMSVTVGLPAAGGLRVRAGDARASGGVIVKVLT